MFRHDESMSDFTNASVEELLDQAKTLPYGPGRVAVVEQAISLADTERDIVKGYEARMEMLDAAVMSGRGDLMIAHFPWCLAKFDKNPDSFDEFQLLWRFKWVLWRAIAFPEISLDQIESLLDDMIERYQKFGAGRRVISSFRRQLAAERGDMAVAKQHYKATIRTPRDHLSDCAACEADEWTELFVQMKDHEGALSVAEDILDDKLSCRTVPEATFATLLNSLYELEEDEEAAWAHRRGMKKSQVSGDLENLAKHIVFLGRSCNLAPATKIMEKHLARAALGYEPRAQFEFLLASRFLCDRLLDDNFARRIRVGEELPDDVKELRKWLNSEVRSIAERFDTRNKSDSYSAQIEQQDELHKNIREISIER
jgi:hypothetical protein